MKGLFFVSILVLSSSITSFTFAQNDISYIFPLEQFKSGVSQSDIKCRSGSILLVRTLDGFPACVKPSTGQTLVERGWGVSKDQLVWFTSVPIACQWTPWANAFANLTGVYRDSYEITVYKDHGITILDAKRLYSTVTSYTHIPNCGEPSLTDAYYFLVLKSDADKMSKLGYKILATPLPVTTSRVQ